MRKTTDTGMEALDTLQPASQTMRESAVPKQRLFTLINDIHDSAEPTGMSQARFSTLMKRQATGEKHADKTACSQLARLAQNQGISTATGMKKTHIKIGNFKS